MKLNDASILIHLDFLSICNHSVALQWGFDSFNPYSPGFSIYFVAVWCDDVQDFSFNPYSPGFSIYLRNDPN